MKLLCRSIKPARVLIFIILILVISKLFFSSDSQPPTQQEPTGLSQKLAENAAKLDSLLPKESKKQPLVTIKKTKLTAVYVILCRNSDIEGVEQTLTNLEEVFNKNHNYPYVFINNEPFTDEFKRRSRAVSPSEMEFVQTIPGSWEYPPWINQTYAKECRDIMHAKNIMYGESESYRHMCRYYSGFFFRHPAVSKYEYYWRVEPYVKFYCQIDQDPFVYLKENNKKYGYVITIKDYRETIPTLWKSAKEWAITRQLASSPLLKFFLDDKKDYNLCHFWSNFEIGEVALWNSGQYLDFFQYLDQAGGFFYERWGDAPVHSVYIALTLKRDEIHFFNNIGYWHIDYYQCSEEGDLKSKCKCPAHANIAESRGYSCHYDLEDYKDTPMSFRDL